MRELAAPFRASLTARVLTAPEVVAGLRCYSFLLTVSRERPERTRRHNPSRPLPGAATLSLCGNAGLAMATAGYLMHQAARAMAARTCGSCRKAK